MGEKQVVLGKVVSAHGVRGAMKILSFTESPENLIKASKDSLTVLIRNLRGG